MARTSSELAKHLARRALNSGYPAFIVASMGRSGSTLVWNAIAKALAEKRYGRLSSSLGRIVKSHAWDLHKARLARGVVYKTHDMASSIAPALPVRGIFLFSRASDAALSVYSCYERFGKGWVEMHLRHLHANGNFVELLERDVLRLEEQVNGWVNETRFPVLAVRYEYLWDNEDKLRAFCDLPISLPKKRARVEKNIDQSYVMKANKLYSELDARIDEMPAIFITSDRKRANRERMV
ncbi:MAG: hypothetical protein L0H73_01750 [Nitrococcus sp.]|nr:hypothetical protein [Nitrococcus sp.]